jgi:sugar lactone lactonase YvrE
MTRVTPRMWAVLNWGTPVVALLAYLAFWPVAIEPRAWEPPRNAGHTGAHQTNDKLAALRPLPLIAGQEGPEHILAHKGLLYTGLANGEVVRLSPEGQEVRDVVVNTGGRPLGLAMDAEGRLLVADAMRGLLRVTGAGPQAKVDVLLKAVDHPVPNDPVRYADAVELGPDGTIWLTDASRRFSARELNSTFEASVLDILEHSCTGRLIAQHPETLVARVVLTGLCFPNGLAFTGDGKSLFVAETGTFRIVKLDLAKLSLLRSPKGAHVPPSLDDALRQGAASVPIDNLPGYPDNLTRTPSGRIWVGLTKPRSPVLDYAASRPWVRSFTLRLPRALWPVPKAYGHIIAFEDSGRIVDDMQDPKGGYPETTSATEIDGKLFVQSLHAPSLAWLPYRGPGVPVPADDGPVERIVGGAPQVRTSP